jgi:hypothetical protein
VTTIADLAPGDHRPSAGGYPPAVVWQALFPAQTATVVCPKEEELSALPAFAVRETDSFSAIFQ